jgi:hypothetical protein
MDITIVGQKDLLGSDERHFRIRHSGDTSNHQQIKHIKIQILAESPPM